MQTEPLCGGGRESCRLADGVPNRLPVLPLSLRMQSQSEFKNSWGEKNRI
jgi:hypothetical protein